MSSEPRVGQIWASNDHRDVGAGRCQRLRVEGIVPERAPASDRVRLFNLDSNRLTTIAARRMRPSATGYRLVEDVR